MTLPLLLGRRAYDGPYPIIADLSWFGHVMDVRILEVLEDDHVDCPDKPTFTQARALCCTDYTVMCPGLVFEETASHQRQEFSRLEYR